MADNDTPRPPFGMEFATLVGGRSAGHPTRKACQYPSNGPTGPVLRYQCAEPGCGFRHDSLTHVLTRHRGEAHPDPERAVARSARSHTSALDRLEEDMAAVRAEVACVESLRKENARLRAANTRLKAENARLKKIVEPLRGLLGGL
jgi:hypothetical protein